MEYKKSNLFSFQLRKTEVIVVYPIRPKAIVAGNRDSIKGGKVAIGRKVSVFVAKHSCIVISFKSGALLGYGVKAPPKNLGKAVAFFEICYSEMGGNEIGSVRGVGMAVGGSVENLIFRIVDQICII